MMTSSEELIYQEIVSHYLPEELPSDNEDFLALLPELANNSAGRLYSMTTRNLSASCSDHVNGLIHTLEVVTSNQNHPLLARIKSSSLLDWEEDPELDLLQVILSIILTKLRSLLTQHKGQGFGG